ncbi:MAG: aldo/keto reductase [Bacteroidia bacterium]|nr:aldo/keto reductase [Bacteroidales bacterium]NCD42775.1 aldo/keto reductase [Bacteroidia bacterium]MDD2322149.1 aldo/keto reductase [Bacteroidales bacterium]MDD3011407.1 aldo/keto reductase [Bacteroidales bacterium]MDD3961419.1 aldo/keto reductase [Bacteroidales bacterium]
MRRKTEKIIYGCMGLGGAVNTTVSDLAVLKKTFMALETAYDSGIYRFDHADIYNQGRAESVFGLWLKDNPGLRSKIFLQSKTGINLHAGPYNSSYYDFSETYLSQHVEQILARLHTDYLDSLLLHRPDPLASGEALARVLQPLVKNGTVRSLGVSNMSVWQIQWLEHALQLPVRVNQIRFSLGHSLLVDQMVWVNSAKVMNHGLDGMLSFASQYAVELQAWSPLDKGLFLSPFAADAKNIPATAGLLKELSQIYDVAPGVIALSWVLRVPQVAAVIGTTRPERIKALVEASRITLSHDDWYRLWITASGEKLP